MAAATGKEPVDKREVLPIVLRLYEATHRAASIEDLIHDARALVAYLEESK